LQIRSLCEIPVEVDEPAAAIRQFVRILREHTVPTEKARVAIRLTGTSARARTAIQEFNPRRTEGAAFAQGLAIVEELALLSAAKLKSVTLILSAEDFLWKGAGTGSGKLHLLDLRVFRRKQRFGMNAMLDLQDVDARSDEISALLAVIKKETGLGFSLEASAVHFETSDTQRATAEQLLVTHLAWNELLLAVSEKVRPSVDILALPGLMSSSASIQYRFDPSKMGRSVRVDFRKITRRWFKEHFADYKPRSVHQDDHGIKKEIAPGMHLFLYFDKRAGSFSKAFRAWLGIAFSTPRYAATPNRPYNLQVDFLDLFDLFMFGWSYFTKEELDAALEGARPIIRAVLALMEQEAPLRLSRAFERKLDEFEGPREITARQAFDLIHPVAQRWASDAALDSIQLFPVITTAEPLFAGPPLHAGQGRLGPGGQWRMIFHSRMNLGKLQVLVPWRGPIRGSRFGFSRGESMFTDEKMAALQGLQGLGDGWIDSGRALELALANVAAEGLTDKDLNLFELRHDWRRGSTWRLFAQKKGDQQLTAVHVQVPADGEGEVQVSVTRYDKTGMPVDR